MDNSKINNLAASSATSGSAVTNGVASAMENTSGQGVVQNANVNAHVSVSASANHSASTGGEASVSTGATTDSLGNQLVGAMLATAVRQFRFPEFLRGLTEALIFCGIYLVAGIISLGVSVEEMLAPMVPVVLLMMFCMVASGVYRSEITNSILNLYIHSIYGFFLASIGFILLTFALPPEYSQPKFIFFFLFFAFFVVNTLRPIISGTDFMDGGGRRKN